MEKKENSFLLENKTSSDSFTQDFTEDTSGSFFIQPRLENTERFLNTDITKGDILDYVTETKINTPPAPLDIGELGKVLLIKKVDTTPTITDIQIITDPETQLDNLRLAFKYGLSSVGYLEQVDLDLTVEGLNDYFSIVLSGFTIDPVTFDKGDIVGCIFINVDTIAENPLTATSNLFVEYGSDDKLSIIHASLYARNMLLNDYKDIQYEEITDPIDCPTNIGEAKLLRQYNINFVYNDVRYGRRIALSRSGGKSGYKPYLQYKIVKELKYNNFTFATTQKPYDNQTLKTILEQKQRNYIIDNYNDVINVDSSNFIVKNQNSGFQTWNCVVDFELYESVWFFNLIVNVA